VMEFEDWEPLYEEILEEFGYERPEDRGSARVLNDLLEATPDPAEKIDAVRGERVVVVGNAPSLKPSVVPALGEALVVSADGASERLADAGVASDVIVTDLDGAPRHAAEASHEGAVVVVHAHGDNRGALERWLPEFDTRNVVGTTQADPDEFDALHNFGGFTDGDRAVFLADEFGADELELAGFDFGDATGEKLKKLRWARRLIREVEAHRDESIL